MTSSSERILTAWGNSSSSRSRVFAPGDANGLQSAIAVPHARGVIARGYGRSYGDQCLNDGGDVIDTTAFTGIQSFDTTTGVMQCDPGVSFTQVMAHCLPQGWMPAVCPGTAVVSMGGAIANDVHGKNQHHAGTFADHVTWFDLRLPDGSLRRVSRDSDTELFRATVGGIGLTGVIQGMQIQLQRAAVNALSMTESRIANLDAFLEQLTQASVSNEYAVGWIDAMQRGAHLGRGVLEVANAANSGVNVSRQRTFNLPFNFPPFLLNGLSVGAFNELYFRRIPVGGRTRNIHAEQFLYPLDAIHNWNRMYGTPGVYQFQCGLPVETSREGLRDVMEETVKSRSASFLAVIKCMGRSGVGMLSFTKPGFSLALDFPRRPDTFALVHRLHDIVLKHGGRVYLAKDACLTSTEFAAMYPEHSAFTAVLRRIDPNGIMQSDMGRRLKLC